MSSAGAAPGEPPVGAMAATGSEVFSAGSEGDGPAGNGPDAGRAHEIVERTAAIRRKGRVPCAIAELVC